MRNRSHYILLANLFRYPDKEYKKNIEVCKQMLAKEYPLTFLKAMPFFEYIEKTDIDNIEEIFSMTFHIQAICFLDLGYVLFAEDYKRGDFLVKVKNEQLKVKNDCGDELADNLPNILTLMAKMEDMDFLDEFAIRIVKPALEKMLSEFDLARMALKNQVRLKKQRVLLETDEKNRNIYQYALQTIYDIVMEDFKHVKYNDPIIQPTLGNFMKNCNTGCGPTSAPQPIKN